MAAGSPRVLVRSYLVAREKERKGRDVPYPVPRVGEIYPVWEKFTIIEVLRCGFDDLEA